MKIGSLLKAKDECVMVYRYAEVVITGKPTLVIGKTYPIVKFEEYIGFDNENNKNLCIIDEQGEEHLFEVNKGGDSYYGDFFDVGN